MTMDWILRCKLAYGGVCLGLSLLSISFNYYYVQVFQKVYFIDEKWWNFDLTVYLIWNCINDLILSHLQDNVKCKFTRTRQACITSAAPLLSFVFMLAWCSWGYNNAGFHLMFVLMTWDTVQTFMSLAASCLFTEMTRKTIDRLNLLGVARIASLFGTAGVILQDKISESLSNFSMFQVSSLLLALCSLVLLYCAGYKSHTLYDADSRPDCDRDLTEVTTENKPRDITLQFTYLEQMKQMFSCNLFRVFVAVNFLQELHRTFYSNFLCHICDLILPEDVLSWEVRNTLYNGVYLVSNLLVILGLPAANKLGHNRLIHASFVCKVCIGILMLMIGPTTYPILTACLICTDCCLNHASFAFFCLPLSEIVDIDAKRFNRKHPVTSIFYGMSSFLVKPAIFLSPILFATLFDSYGFEDLKNSIITAETHYRLKNSMYYSTCVYSVVIGGTQIFLWSIYQAKHSNQ